MLSTSASSDEILIIDIPCLPSAFIFPVDETTARFMQYLNREVEVDRFLQIDSFFLPAFRNKADTRPDRVFWFLDFQFHSIKKDRP